MARPRSPRDRDDPTTAARRASAADRDEHLYARKRARYARRRADTERQHYDPAPPDPDRDWTVEDEEGAGLRRATAPSPVGDTMAALVKRRGWAERLSGAQAAARWAEIVGPDLVARCEPVRLAGGLLVVRAESQIWATQLRYMLPQLRDKANAVLGEGRVREVRLVVGTLEGRDT